MSITQSFLPVMVVPESRVVGAVPIPEQSFTGDETTVTLGGTVYPLSRKDVVSVAGSGGLTTAHSYMMIPFSATDERNGKIFAVRGLLGMDVLMEYITWVTPKNVSMELGRNASSLFKMLLGAKATSANSLVSIPPTNSLGPAPMEITVQANLGSAPACSYFDIDFLDWMSGYSDKSLIPTGLSLGLPAPLLVSSHLKQFMVSTPHPFTIDPTKPDRPDVQFNTLRFIKVASGVIPPGTYSYTFQISTVQGVTIPGILNLVL